MAKRRVRVTRARPPHPHEQVPTPIPAHASPSSPSSPPPNNPSSSSSGLSLRYIYKQTPALYRNNAIDVSVTHVKSTLSKGGYPAVTSKTTTPTSRSPQVYSTWVVGKEKDKLIHRQTAVMVQCSCPNYMYVWEYANSTLGAARIIYGNGDSPIVTNPGLSPGMCKHLCALAQHIFVKKL